MKKIVMAGLLFALVSSVIALAIPARKNEKNLVGSTWRFKVATSENPSTADYLNVMYNEAEYKFSDNNTYTGSFCSLPLSGTWEISNNTLILNKGTHKEETYPLTLVSQSNFVLQTTEKGNKVFIEFVKQ